MIYVQHIITTFSLPCLCSLPLLYCHQSRGLVVTSLPSPHSSPTPASNDPNTTDNSIRIHPSCVPSLHAPKTQSRGSPTARHCLPSLSHSNNPLTAQPNTNSKTCGMTEYLVTATPSHTQSTRTRHALLQKPNSHCTTLNNTVQHLPVPKLRSCLHIHYRSPRMRTRNTNESASRESPPSITSPTR